MTPPRKPGDDVSYGHHETCGICHTSGVCEHSLDALKEAMTRPDSEAPDEVWCLINSEGKSTGACSVLPFGFAAWEKVGFAIVRYVKATKADGGADGAALSEGELSYFRAQGGSVLINEIDRLRARERRMVEAINAVMALVWPSSAVFKRLRAALEDP